MITAKDCEFHPVPKSNWRWTETTPMTFSVFVPDHEPGASLPVLWYLSGLTCTHANVTEKGEFRQACAEAGVIFIAPDTSPRGDVVRDDDGYDFVEGNGRLLFDFLRLRKRERRKQRQQHHRSGTHQAAHPTSKITDPTV